MINLTATVPDLHLDFDLTLPCEGTYHPLNIEGHVIDAPGAFHVTSPCGSSSVIQCKPRVDYMRRLNYFMCLTCDTTHHIGDYRFDPI